MTKPEVVSVPRRARGADGKFIAKNELIDVLDRVVSRNDGTIYTHELETLTDMLRDYLALATEAHDLRAAAPSPEPRAVVTRETIRSPLFQKFVEQGFWHAHHVDLVWRIDGKEVREQADWLKSVWYAVKAEPRAVEAGDAVKDAQAVVVTLNACGREWESFVVERLLAAFHDRPRCCPKADAQGVTICTDCAAESAAYSAPAPQSAPAPLTEQERDALLVILDTPHSLAGLDSDDHAMLWKLLHIADHHRDSVGRKT